MPRSTPIAILLALLACLCLPAQPSAAQVIPKPNATREQLRTLIYRQNTTIADLKSDVAALKAKVDTLKKAVAALTPPMPAAPKPVPVAGAPLVLVDPVLNPQPGAVVAWIRAEQVAHKDTGDVRWPDLLACLIDLPASVQWCVLDLETGWMQDPAMLKARDADAAAVMAFCHAVRPGIKFGRYGWPITTCDSTDDAPGGWHAIDGNLPGWNSVDFLSPSIYQGSLTADPECVRAATLHALTLAKGKPVFLIASDRVYTGADVFKLCQPDQMTAHVQGGFGPAATVDCGGVKDQADGVIFWRSTYDYRNAVQANGEIPAGVSLAEYIAWLDTRSIAVFHNAIKGETNPLPPPPTGSGAGIPTPPTPPATQPTPPPVIGPGPGIPPGGGSAYELPFTVAAPVNPSPLGLSGGRLFLDGLSDKVSTGASITGTMAPFPGLPGLWPTPYHGVLVNDNASAARIEINQPVFTNLLGYAVYLGGGSDIRINAPHFTAAAGTWENAIRIHTAQHVLIDGGWTDYRKGSKDALRVYLGASVCVRGHVFKGGSIHIGWPPGVHGGDSAGPNGGAEAWLIDCTLDNPNDTTASKYPKPFITYPGIRKLHLWHVTIIEGSNARIATAADVDGAAELVEVKP